MLAKDYRHAASEKLRGYRGTAILAMIIVSLITGVLTGLTRVGSIFVTGAFSVGTAVLYLNISRGFEPKIENIFEGFKKCYGKSLVAYILVSIFTFLWSLLFVIPGIMKAYSYSQTYNILADHPEMSGKDAIDESKRIMQGNRWRLFCLQFSFIGWFLLSVCTCGILLLWVWPYYQQAVIEFYESIKDQGTAFEQTYQQTIDVTVDDATATQDETVAPESADVQNETVVTESTTITDETAALEAADAQAKVVDEKDAEEDFMFDQGTTVAQDYIFNQDTEATQDNADTTDDMFDED